MPHILRNLRDSLNANPEQIRRMCAEYLAKRTGTYEFRTRRYKAVAKKLYSLGLGNDDTVVDIGAGYCEFDRYLRSPDCGNWHGIYQPIDGVVDGTNLELWKPPVHAHFFTAIEVLEHLHDPDRMLRQMARFATKGAVITTPNPDTVDVPAMDDTHLQELYPVFFADRDWYWEVQSLFGTPDDTIIAWWKP